MSKMIDDGFRDDGPMGSINVTSLVDVMFCLLIMFMVSTPLMSPEDHGPPAERAARFADPIRDHAPWANENRRPAQEVFSRLAGEGLLQILAHGRARRLFEHAMQNGGYRSVFELPEA